MWLVMCDWSASMSELLAMWIVGNRKRKGFLLGFVSDLLWIVLGVSLGLWGLVTVAVVAAVINIRNYRKWGASK